MKILYLECSMGAAGDMLTAALFELIKNKDAFLQEINNIGIPGVVVKSADAVKCGIKGTHINVTVNGETEESEDHHFHEHGHGHEHNHEHNHDHSHEQEHQHDHSHDHHDEHEHEHNHEHAHEHTHHHSDLHEIEHIINGLKLSEKVKSDALAVYSLIAEAESAAHGVPVTEVHFHEVGTMDAIADITAVCLLMDKLAPDKVIVSPIHVGFGHVKTDHGILPVPAPATAYILQDVPAYGGRIKGELCTPTGAALLKHFADSFGDMPIMKTQKIGYGMGKKDFEAANCVRAFLGETEDSHEKIFQLSFNVDDMTAEEIAFAAERLFEKGALEVFTLPAQMKKSRPGTLIEILCHDNNREEIVNSIFKYTTTIGIRETPCTRYILDRSITKLETPYGEVNKKESEGYGIFRTKYEYNDLARIAIERNISFREAEKLINSSFDNII